MDHFKVVASHQFDVSLLRKQRSTTLAKKMVTEVLHTSVQSPVVSGIQEMIHVLPSLAVTGVSGLGAASTDEARESRVKAAAAVNILI